MIKRSSLLTLIVIANNGRIDPANVAHEAVVPRAGEIVLALFWFTKERGWSSVPL
jgi:hypothetical protein